MRPTLAALPAAALLALQLPACAVRGPDLAPGHGARRHAAEAAMIGADEALSAASVGRDARAFGRLVAEDAIFFSARGLREGRAAVLEAWRPMLTEGGPLLRWAPHRAEASAGGDLGFTVGRWELTAGGEVATGEYLTVWRLRADGRAEAVLDGTFLEVEGAAPPADATVVRELRSRDGDLVATLSRLDGPDGPALSLAIATQPPGGAARRLETRVPLTAR